MLESTRGLRAIVLAAIVLCIVASLTGAKAGQDKNGLKVAVVDSGRLSNEYTFIINAERELINKDRDLGIALRTWLQNPLLTDKEQDELGKLIVIDTNANANQPGLNDQQKKRRQELIDKSKNLNDELVALSNKKVGDITPQERQKLDAFSKLGPETQARVNTELDKWKDELNKKKAANITQAVKVMRDSVAKVAKEKGYNLVFDSGVVFYADGDITDPVLSLMNKTK